MTRKMATDLVMIETGKTSEILSLKKDDTFTIIDGIVIVEYDKVSDFATDRTVYTVSIKDNMYEICESALWCLNKYSIEI